MSHRDVTQGPRRTRRDELCLVLSRTSILRVLVIEALKPLPLRRLIRMDSDGDDTLDELRQRIRDPRYSLGDLKLLSSKSDLRVVIHSAIAKK